jgi:hypothetical protein
VTLPILIAFALSFWKPMFEPRYLFVSVVPLFILMARGLGAIPNPWLASAFTAAFVVTQLYSDWKQRADQLEDYRSAVRFVQGHAATADAVVVSPSYFALPYRAAQVELAPRGPVITVPPADWRFWLREETERSSAIPPSAVSGGRRLWLIRPPARKDRKADVEVNAAEDAIRSRLVLRRTLYFQGLKIMEFAPRNNARFPSSVEWVTRHLVGAFIAPVRLLRFGKPAEDARGHLGAVLGFRFDEQTLRMPLDGRAGDAQGPRDLRRRRTMDDARKQLQLPRGEAVPAFGAIENPIAVHPPQPAGEALSVTVALERHDSEDDIRLDQRHRRLVGAQRHDGFAPDYPHQQFRQAPRCSRAEPLEELTKFRAVIARMKFSFTADHGGERCTVLLYI